MQEQTRQRTHVHVYGTNYPYTPAARAAVEADSGLHQSVYAFLGQARRQAPSTCS